MNRVQTEVTSKNRETFQFGPFRACTRRRLLETESGPVPVGARAFDLLIILLERVGQLLSKQELLDLVWAGQAVEEGNLHVQIAALRRALGEHQGLIQNVPGRGYRFTGQLINDESTNSSVLLPIRPDPPSGMHKTLVGREAERAELQAALLQSRLVTLVGPGGVGKTQLAVTVMQDMAPHFANSTRFIDFAPLSDASLVASAVLAALDLRGGENVDPAQTIADALKDRPSLLLFDNCEHVLHATAVLADGLLAKSASVSIIATSREPLRVAGETMFRLDPLGLAPRELSNPRELQRFGAVALFVQRTVACDRRFQLHDGNGPMVADICRQLDGMPLALEMAAARMPSLGIEGLRDRLNESLSVLTGGARTATSRQQTLRDTVAWSYDLLDPIDRAVFRALGIFAGGFTLEAACAIVLPPPADEWLVIDSISRLIDKSMVIAGPGERPRYRLLDTLRLFAVEETAKHGEQAALAARHAAYFETLFEDAYQSWETTADKVWLARMSPELDNLRAALDWAINNSPSCLVGLAGSSALLFEKLSLFAEGRRYLQRAEEAVGPDTPPDASAQLYWQIGILWHPSDRSRALVDLERAEQLYRGLPDRTRLGRVLAVLGFVQSSLGAAAAAQAALQEALTLLRGSGHQKSLFVTLNNLGTSAAVTGDMAAAREFFEEALSLAKGSGAPEKEAWILMNLAEVAFCLGDVETAAARGLAAIGRFRALGEKADLGWALVNLTNYLLIQGRTQEAEETAYEALMLVREIGGFILRVCLQQWALLTAIGGDVAEAARLLGFVDFGFDSAGETREQAEQQVHEHLLAALDGQMPDEKRSRLALEGASWNENDAVKRVAALRQN
jgi:predicted ATPase/DNA-binding winged helix-turn-helix (wHTH) protein